MRTLAVLSMHTSPLARAGTGDGGGMNVYVRELASALARAGVRCDVYTRAWGDHLAAFVDVEPGLRVHHVAAGPLAPVPKAALPDLVEEFTDGVLQRLVNGYAAEALHANYWLSGLAGHRIKHELDLPLVSTFHTLDRVKAEADMGDDNLRRSQAEGAVIGCSDAILASCTDEVAQLVRLYGADPTRVEIVAPGVDHAFFGPGDRRQARRAVGLDPEAPMVLFVGRIQPLKGIDVAIEAFGAVAARFPQAVLVVVGGPSGVEGPAEVDRAHRMVDRLGLSERVRFVEPQPHEMLSTYYRAASVCLVPSRSESFGLVALEAAACGTPVVATAVGGLITLVEDGLTGFLVDGRDPADFAARASRILAEPALAGAMAARAATRAGGYTWPTAAARLRRLYAELTARQLVDCG